MSSGTSVLIATVMTAAVATAVAAHPTNTSGTTTMRAVPRCWIVALNARNSSSLLVIITATLCHPHRGQTPWEDTAQLWHSPCIVALHGACSFGQSGL